jgi:hypothetical protein
MSAVYRTIARARDTAKALLEDPNPQWNKSTIVQEMGVSYGLYSDIMALDPVVVGEKIRTPTVKNLDEFIERHKKQAPPLAPSMTIKSKVAESPPLDPPKSEDPLTRLDNLVAEFAKRGYKLETRIIKINQEL